MSYTVHLNDPVTGETIEFDSPHQMKGSIYEVGGSKRASLGITCNYSIHFGDLGDDGIRSINGLTGAKSVDRLLDVANGLGNDATDNYWQPTQGNAKRALLHLAAMANMRPDGVWSVI